MATNPDPRPGRWLLPLVVLGMVVFTYVFVNALPGADADPQDLSGATTSTTTTAPGDGGQGDTTTTTTITIPVSNEAQAYLDALEAYETRLTDFQAEVATINSQWDADPREISYSDAEAAFADLAERVGLWADEVSAEVPPEALIPAHDTVVQFANLAAAAAADVLEGLQAPDSGEARRAAVEQFDQAILGFTAAVDDAAEQAQALGA